VYKKRSFLSYVLNCATNGTGTAGFVMKYAKRDCPDCKCFYKEDAVLDADQFIIRLNQNAAWFV
jgi:hypothetical protein